MPRGSHKTSRLDRTHLPKIEQLIENLCAILNHPPEGELLRLRAILREMLVYSNDARVLAVVKQIMRERCQG